MEKHVSFGSRVEIIECDIDIDYNDFMSKVKEIFELRNESFCIKDLTENNFYELIITKDFFYIVRSEKDMALERLDGKKDFITIRTVQEAEDFFTVYGFNVDEYGRTPLYCASYVGRVEIVKLILKKGFKNVHRISYSGETPLYCAAKNGNIEVVKLLLEQDFDNAHMTYRGNSTPINVAAYNGHTEIVEMLLKKDFCNAHEANICNNTPLYMAAFKGYTEIVKLILGKGYDNAHKENYNNETPLSAAAAAGHTEIVKLLEKDIDNRACLY